MRGNVEIYTNIGEWREGKSSYYLLLHVVLLYEVVLLLLHPWSTTITIHG